MPRTIRPGFTANVVQTASNKATLLAFVAMAQALVVITAGIDLCVGMVLTLTNCLASWLVVGTALETGVGVRGGAGGGAGLRGAERADRDLRPAAADRDDDRHGGDLLRAGADAAAVSRRVGQRDAGRRADRAVLRGHPGEPRGAGADGALDLGAVPALGDRARGLCRGVVGGRGLHVGDADQAGQVHWPTRCRGCWRRWAGCS